MISFLLLLSLIIVCGACLSGAGRGPGSRAIDMMIAEYDRRRTLAQNEPSNALGKDYADKVRAYSLLPCNYGWQRFCDEWDMKHIETYKPNIRVASDLTSDEFIAEAEQEVEEILAGRA